MLVTGFPYNVHKKADEFLKVFGRVLKQARAVRRLGSAAIDICWVAAGRMEGFWEASLKPWDTRAAALILEEAGGRVTGMDGKTWNPDERPHPRHQRPDSRRSVANHLVRRKSDCNVLSRLYFSLDTAPRCRLRTLVRNPSGIPATPSRF